MSSNKKQYPYEGIKDRWPTPHIIKDIVAFMKEHHKGANVKVVMNCWLYIGCTDTSLKGKEHILYKWIEAGTRYSIWVLSPKGSIYKVPIGWEPTAYQLYALDRR